MRAAHKMLIIGSLLLSQQVFADFSMQKTDMNDRPCAVLAKACSDAGFIRDRSEEKGIWRNCMEPLLLGKSVSQVKVDSAAIKACRTHKINELKMELQRLKDVK